MYVAMNKVKVRAEDGHATVYLYLSCVEAKITTQSLLRDFEKSCHQKHSERTGCAVVQQASS